MKWTKGGDRLPGLFKEVEWRNAEGGNIPLGKATPIEHYNRCGSNINWHEWLDESQSGEAAAKEVIENVLYSISTEKGNTLLTPEQCTDIAEGLLSDLHNAGYTLHPEQGQEEALSNFLKFVDEGTHFFRDKDVTISQVVHEYLKNSTL